MHRESNHTNDPDFIRREFAVGRCHRAAQLCWCQLGYAYSPPVLTSAQRSMRSSKCSRRSAGRSPSWAWCCWRYRGSRPACCPSWAQQNKGVLVKMLMGGILLGIAPDVVSLVLAK